MSLSEPSWEMVTFHPAHNISDRNPIDWRLLHDFACGDNHHLLSQEDDWTQAGAETMPHTITQPCWERIKGFVVTTHSDTGSDRRLIFNLTFTSVEEMSSPGWFLSAASVNSDMSSQDEYKCVSVCAQLIRRYFGKIQSGRQTGVSQDAFARGCSQWLISCWQPSHQCESVIWRQGVSWGYVSLVASEWE